MRWLASPFVGGILAYVFKSIWPTFYRNVPKLEHFGKILSMKTFQCYATGVGDLDTERSTALNQVMPWTPRPSLDSNHVESKGRRNMSSTMPFGKLSKLGAPDHVEPIQNTHHVASLPNVIPIHWFTNVDLPFRLITCTKSPPSWFGDRTGVGWVKEAT